MVDHKDISDVTDNDVEKILFNKLNSEVAELEYKILSTSKLFHKLKYDTDKQNLEKKIEDDAKKYLHLIQNLLRLKIKYVMLVGSLKGLIITDKLQKLKNNLTLLVSSVKLSSIISLERLKIKYLTLLVLR